MKKQTLNNAKVGLFVVAGVAFLILTLYMIGRNRNLFGYTFKIQASLSNVNGLIPGNNVRFKGIDVGTVEYISIQNDTSIIVGMVIDQKMKAYIRKNVIASVGTDGLMGNKLININSQAGDSELIEEGDLIGSLEPVETDEMLRTLNTTNTTIERVTGNLYEITAKLNSSKSLWGLLSDTVITQDLKKAVEGLKTAGTNTAEVTRKTKVLLERFERSNGIAQTLLTDTTLSRQLVNAVRSMEEASVKTPTAVDDIQRFIDEMRKGQGTARAMFTDTLLREKFLNSATNIEQGTGRFNENMEALKSNFLFRRYFKKQERKNKSKSN
jgi:phospholipid/cholesterol/gamma-HCH transport system substrate-binding protein